MVETTYQISIPSSYEHLGEVEKLIEDVCETFNVSEDYYGNILVAVTEAVNNSIQHGNKSDPSKSIRVNLEVTGKELSFKITDEGEGFDHNKIPDPTDPENIEKINGRGVFLMKNLSDRVEFDDSGRAVTLFFLLSPKAEMA